jgi:hypothetical protein
MAAVLPFTEGLKIPPALPYVKGGDKSSPLEKEENIWNNRGRREILCVLKKEF